MLYQFPLLKCTVLTGIFPVLFSCDGNTKQETCGGSNSHVEIPRICQVKILDPQPHETDAACIWYDDFDEVKAYLESSGELDFKEYFGSGGGSMRAGFVKGEIDGEGNRKLAFGDFPSETSVVAKGKHFDEIYWRIYVKHEYGWTGSPAKMSRATSIVSQNWQQAMIAHVWSGDNNCLTLDPARGVKGQTDSIQTTGYNDFENLSWLGNEPCSAFQISSTGESGYWVLVEASARLNTPGKSDGSTRLWIDGRLEADRENLNFRGSYTRHGINAVFLESYWNGGAVKTEGRWFDNFVVSTEPIGPVYCSPNPVLYKTPFHGPGSMEAWEVELASDVNGNDVVFNSHPVKGIEQIAIDTDTGTFTGSLQNNIQLLPGTTYFCRVRQKGIDGDWSDWSRWHQQFKVGKY